MIIKTYKVDNKTYTVEYVTSSAIDEHYVIALQEEPTIELIQEMYKANMLKACEQRLAICVKEEDVLVGFMYNYIEDYSYIGASIVSTTPISTLLLFKTVFEINNKSHKINFVPHNDNSVKKFMSILYGPSIRRYKHGKGFVTVLRSEMEEKGHRIFTYLGLEEV